MRQGWPPQALILRTQKVGHHTSLIPGATKYPEFCLFATGKHDWFMEYRERGHGSGAPQQARVPNIRRQGSPCQFLAFQDCLAAKLEV